jgi:hypothetical protein
MTTAQAYKLGQRAARAEAKGDEDAARALVRDVVRAASYAKDKAQGQALCAAFEQGCHGEEA